MFDRIKRLFAKPDSAEVTGIQLKKAPYGAGAAAENEGAGVIVGTNATLEEPLPSTIQTWRTMRKDPTIALARNIATAPIRTATYAIKLVEDAPEEYRDFLTSMVEPLWRGFMRNMVLGLDYGFAPFEKVYAFNRETGKQYLTKLKPLLAEHSHVMLHRKTGAFLGAVNGVIRGAWDAVSSNTVALPPEKVFWYTHNREADYWYGESCMERAREAYNRSLAVASKAANYHTNIVGAVPVVEYPEGAKSKDRTGREIANFKMAGRVLQSLQKAVGIAMPGIQAAWMRGLAEKGLDPSKFSAWRIQMFENKTRHGPEFEQALKGLDVAKIRAWLLPERAVIEGQYGTKAEAEIQTQTAMVSIDAILQDIFDAINKWIINPLLLVNFGEKAVNQAKLIAEQQDPRKAELLREIVKGIFGAPVNAELFTDVMNIPDIFALLDLPLHEDYEANLEAAPRSTKQPAKLSRGDGLGRMGGPVAGGPGGKCVCKECGATATHKTGAPCSDIKCPKCGATMTRPPDDDKPAALARNANDAAKEHGHPKVAAGKVGWFFHNTAEHDGGTGYNHCQGGPANPYKISHATVDSKLQHVINKEYGLGHGEKGKAQWFRFTKNSGKKWLLESGEEVSAKDVPESFKHSPTGDSTT